MTRPANEDDIVRIYRATLDDLYGFVARRCDGDRDLAEDITQEAWLRAVRAWYEDGLPDQPLAWLTTVSRNLLANHFRRRPAEFLEEDVAEAVAEEGPDHAEERMSLLSRALARLPVAQMQLLRVFHLERRKVAEIAAGEGLSERAVEGRLRRARQQLRKQIESESEGEIS
jgi:RNA polymerase sigma-70 factor (ECF subfamily)